MSKENMQGAPKDGTRILVEINGRYEIAFFSNEARFGAGAPKKPGWVIHPGNIFVVSPDTPTGWSYLPLTREEAEKRHVPK